MGSIGEMAGFMPQDVFNVCVLVAARASVSGFPMDEIAEKLMETHKKDYKDNNLKEDIIDSANKVINHFNDGRRLEELYNKFGVLMYCVSKYDELGHKRRMTLFGGTWFNKEKNMNYNKVEDSLIQLSRYSVFYALGTIPPIPKNWKL